MWSYYGAKTNIVHLYPPPKYGKIIEPFAGTARYALKYWDREVLLVDKYDVIIKIWKWLQLCSPGDIKRLPRKLHKGMNIDEIKFDCEEAKLLMGFLVSKAVESPRRKVTDWVAVGRPNFANYLIQKIASNLHKIKHWDIKHGSFEELENQEATWFIDPPYEFGGHSYKHSNKEINFNELAHWCQSRNGQVIVCETEKSKWLPFIPIAKQKGRKCIQHEVFWTNEPTSYGAVQTSFL